MRVRPFFWIFLVAVCSSVLIFAVTISVYRSVPMQAHIDQISTSVVQTTEVRLRLTDSEGLPIDQARIIPQVSMLAMPMDAQQVHVQALGQGIYLAQISFSMAGSWQIDLIAQADGFDAAHQSIQLNVV
jgi:nitrogen fixation protein FixH